MPQPAKQENHDEIAVGLRVPAAIAAYVSTAVATGVFAPIAAHIAATVATGVPRPSSITALVTCSPARMTTRCVGLAASVRCVARTTVALPARMFLATRVARPAGVLTAAFRFVLCKGNQRNWHQRHCYNQNCSSQDVTASNMQSHRSLQIARTSLPC